MLIGGDHSAAAGYWSGIAQAHQPRGDIGLVWIDAHMDSHTPFTSPNGYVHGMPLAALLGHGDPGLTGLLSPRAKLRPDRVCLIGTRDFEPEEAALLLDVRVFYMGEVRSRGWNAFWTTRWRSSDARPPASASHWTWTASNPAMPRGQHAFPERAAQRRAASRPSPPAARPPLRGPGNFGVQSFRGQGWTHAGLHAGRGSEPCARQSGGAS